MLLRRAASPPAAASPVRVSASRMSVSALSQRTSSVLGGNKKGELRALNGGHFVGGLLAGRPHGTGQYWAPDGGNLRLEYDGEWVQGRREGSGTMYYRSGEWYRGSFLANDRHGSGQYEYRNRDVYVGEWHVGRRRGLGTLYYANGDCYVGFWMNDRREGLGTFYWVQKGQKYDGEWVNDRPKCGALSPMEPHEFEEFGVGPPPGGQASLGSTASSSAALAETAGSTASAAAAKPPATPGSRIPVCLLKQPYKVMSGEVVSLRRSRSQGRGYEGRAGREAQLQMGALDDSQLGRLRHAFVALAGGDTPRVGLQPHLLRDVCVLAGLDPAGPDLQMQRLVEDLMSVVRNDGLLYFNDFLRVLMMFRIRTD